MRALTEHHQAQLAATAGARVFANECPWRSCSICAGPVGVLKTTTRHGKTLAHGHFVVHETVYSCPKCTVKGPDDKRSRHLFVKRQEELESILLPKSGFGYDVMTFCGVERFLKYRQRAEIQADLKRRFDIDISTGKISDLERTFTVYLKALHESCAPLIMALLCSGGYPLHIDATCETGRGTIFVAYCGSPELVLGAWKIPTERSDAILPKLRGIERLFGAPCSIMRDLGRAVTEAAIELVGERLIPIFACHLHFLKDIGKDLTIGAHDELRDLFRRYKVRARLASHARALGREIGTDIDKVQAMVNGWLDGDRHQALPAGINGLAVVRALAQWSLDYAADGTDAGFPFDQPMLDLYNRCLQALRVVESLLLHPSTEKATNRALVHLHGILLPVRSQIPFERPARTLKARAQLFQELRDVLRLEVKPGPVAF